ncbi:MAG: formylglycine-generating enzyme family protein, partial [Anaerolineae bacterium]|nr:formylglycine-generating enzyme family protein [Anaerolineae bacterium]
DIFSSEGWEPLVETHNPAICASLWEGNGLKLWTLCNRAENEATGNMLPVPYEEGLHFFDLIRGEKITPQVIGGQAELGVTIRPRGVGAIIAGHANLFDDDFDRFLASQKALDARADFDAVPPPHEETLTVVSRTRSYPSVSADMVTIPARTFDLKVEFQMRECGFYAAEGMPPLDLRYANLHKPAGFTRPVDVKAFALDLTPVTNAQFAHFLQESGYVPAQADNFLRHWPDGQLPAALHDHPVVYVDLADMRAYAQWAGKRLPTEEEWQHAAQGFAERVYPWGDSFAYGLCNGGAGGGTTPVTAFPDGRSPFGPYDLCGNVWETTESERTDGRTRFCILKGGSYYKALGSEWYADGGPQPNPFSAKLILSWPGLDRCATIGFRCAADIDSKDVSF